MPRPKPTKIIIEFNDGSKASSDFQLLPSQLQYEILSQRFASKASSKPEAEKFVVLEWQDGWKEVIIADETCSDINRYYVISRPEDVGRLSLKKEDGYPELIEIIRKPLDLTKITFLDTYSLTLERSIREGKKVDHFYSLKNEEDIISTLTRDLKKAMKDEGLDHELLHSPNSLQQQGYYERIRKRMGIMASKRQQDVYDFIAFLLKVTG